MKKSVLLGVSIIVLASCVSKKKYVELEERHKATIGALQKERLKRESLEAKIQKHVTNFNKKVSSLQELNGNLQKENDVKLDLVGNVAVISNSMKKKMKETLAKVDPAELANARTLKDSMNIAVNYNLKNSIQNSDLTDSNVNVNIDETVVMISIADNLLYKSGSYRISNKADNVLNKLAAIIKSEPSMDVMIEGHTDSQSIKTACLEDNWDLSVKRATSMVRILEKKYGIASDRLIASGRGSSLPLFENDSRENRAKNRRTKIIILPNLDKFFGLLAEKGELKP